MKFLSEKWLGSAILLMAFSLSGAELLVNRDFSKAENGIPVHWEYQKHKSKPQYKLNPATASDPANVEITTADKTSQGLLMFRYKKKLPAGVRITITGEYLTEDLVFGKNGYILISANGKYRGWPAKQPTYKLGANVPPTPPAPFVAAVANILVSTINAVKTIIAHISSLHAYSREPLIRPSVLPASSFNMES